MKKPDGAAFQVQTKPQQRFAFHKSSYRLFDRFKRMKITVFAAKNNQSLFSAHTTVHRFALSVSKILGAEIGRGDDTTSKGARNDFPQLRSKWLNSKTGRGTLTSTLRIVIIHHYHATLCLQFLGHLTRFGLDDSPPEIDDERKYFSVNDL